MERRVYRMLNISKGSTPAHFMWACRVFRSNFSGVLRISAGNCSLSLSLSLSLSRKRHSKLEHRPTPSELKRQQCVQQKRGLNNPNRVLGYTSAKIRTPPPPQTSTGNCQAPYGREFRVWGRKLKGFRVFMASREGPDDKKRQNA